MTPEQEQILRDAEREAKDRMEKWDGMAYAALLSVCFERKVQEAKDRKERGEG